MESGLTVMGMGRAMDKSVGDIGEGDAAEELEDVLDNVGDAGKLSELPGDEGMFGGRLDG